MELKGTPFRIKKILNNNAVVVNDQGQEKIVMGSGLGFQKKKNDIIPKDRVEKVFIMSDKHDQFQELLKTVPEEHVEIAEQIISHAEHRLNVRLNDQIHIALTDHLSFAIHRIKNGIDIHNQMLKEIKVLYKEEYEIGLWGQALIRERLGIDIPDDEVGLIALHIHTAKKASSHLSQTVQQTMMIREMIEIIENCLGIVIDHESLAYQRLLTHLQFALSRFQDKELFDDMDQDMLHMIKGKYAQVYDCAQKIAQHVHQQYGFHFPEAEKAYIALHIQRLVDKSVDKS